MDWKEDSFLLGIAETFKQSPFWNFLDLHVHHLEVGEVQLKLDIRKELLNVALTVHGGVYASILDTTMGLAVRSVSGSPSVTVNLNVTFLKAVNYGRIISVGKIINLGGSLVTVEGQLFDDTQTRIAHATGIFKRIKIVGDEK